MSGKLTSRRPTSRNLMLTACWDHIWFAVLFLAGTGLTGNTRAVGKLACKRLTSEMRTSTGSTEEAESRQMFRRECREIAGTAGGRRAYTPRTCLIQTEKSLRTIIKIGARALP